MRRVEIGLILIAISSTVLWDVAFGTPGDCHATGTKQTVSGSKCGGHSGSGSPCTAVGSCNDNVNGVKCDDGSTAAWIMWDTAPIMSTCQYIGSNSCNYCTGGGMECAQGWLYSSTGGGW
jgi:hypothetical protein